jgi:hypothetical protein
LSIAIGFCWPVTSIINVWFPGDSPERVKTGACTSSSTQLGGGCAQRGAAGSRPAPR